MESNGHHRIMNIYATSVSVHARCNTLARWIANLTYCASEPHPAVVGWLIYLPVYYRTPLSPSGTITMQRRQRLHSQSLFMIYP